MTTWVASFPRSGNTFFRILLWRWYGVRTSTVYSVDGVAERVGRSLVGHGADGSTTFVKTHRQRDRDVADGDRSIYLVRDGRDALVSWAALRSEERGVPWREELAALASPSSPTDTGPWGRNVLSWLRADGPGSFPVIVRYEDLIADPAAVVVGAMEAVAPELSPVVAADRLVAPSFAELHGLDAGFFRRGTVGTHRDEMPAEVHELFWSDPDNADAMDQLGYAR